MDGPETVDDVAMSDRDIGIAVEANGKWPCKERVVSVEGVADETGGVHGSADLERGASLNIRGQGKLVVFLI